MPRASAPKIADPLIAALIAKLPASGTDWPVDRQKAWLRLMANALSTNYGGDVAAMLDEPASAPEPKREVQVSPAASPPAPPKPKNASYPFYVDRDGYAKRKDGRRIMPEEVGDILYDLRGEQGDPSAIVWADDSTGDGGPNITVSVVM